MNYSNFPFVSNNYMFISISLLIIFCILVNWIIDFNIRNRDIKLIVKAGVFLRVLIIIFDNYFEIISFSGGDGRVFHKNGWLGLNNYPYWEIAFIRSVMVPSYKILGEAVPIFIVLLNLLAYTLAIVYLYKSMNLLSKKGLKRKKLIISIISFSLVSALLNVSLLREGIMLFFTTFSIYCYMKRNKIYKMLSIISILISVYFHSGMIFMLTGYIYNFIMKEKGKKRIFYVAIGLFLIVLVGIMINRLPYFKGKSLEKLSEAKIGEYGSTYITRTTGILDYVLTFPIRFFYFLFSPTPNMFRGIKDIMSFLLNSCIYFYFIYDSLKSYKFIKNKFCKKDKLVIQSLCLSYIVTSFVYAMGTITAGTALRHRDKLLFLLALINFYMYFLKMEYYKILNKRKGENL